MGLVIIVIKEAKLNNMLTQWSIFYQKIVADLSDEHKVSIYAPICFFFVVVNRIIKVTTLLDIFNQ